MDSVGRIALVYILSLAALLLEDVVWEWFNYSRDHLTYIRLGLALPWGGAYILSVFAEHGRSRRYRCMFLLLPSSVLMFWYPITEMYARYRWEATGFAP